ncbi:rod shape-determining protein MreD [Thermoleophilia bacterium SCSIO 60948]|nr:rod shape-determining protein MreD [Thermoleophilia bacterium SCSIO 60948]
MIVTRRIGIRIGLILLAAVLLQTSFFSFVELFGTSPDLLAVVVICLGLLGGGVVGAVCGFSAGLLLDSLLLQTLGISSLALLLVGYLAGRFREGFEISNSLTPPLLAAGFTVVAGSAFAAMQLMLGVDAPVSGLVVREILIKGLLAFLLALPVYPLLRRILRPALIDEPSSARVLSEGRAGRRERRRRRGPRIRRRVAAP